MTYEEVLAEFGPREGMAVRMEEACIKAMRRMHLDGGIGGGYPSPDYEEIERIKECAIVAKIVDPTKPNRPEYNMDLPWNGAI